jgi:geranylgeranyl diphosphate synthase type II
LWANGGIGERISRYTPTVLADPLLQRYRSLVDARLELRLPAAESVPAELHQAMRYSCLAPGKRLRPALCLASAEAFGADAATALDAAAALEMVHVFSLIHDDLPAIDDDDLRRGRATCHKVFGEAIAILAGDALFALAFELIASMEASAEVRLACTASLAKASGSGGLVGGEVIDVLSEGKPVEEQTLQLIHARKTGALIAASCEMGALLGGASMADAAALRQFGEYVGLAFQITDDVLNETGSAEDLGKAVGSDRARQKATYPALYGLAESQHAAEAAIRRGIECLPPTVLHSEALQALASYAVARMH